MSSMNFLNWILRLQRDKIFSGEDLIKIFNSLKNDHIVKLVEWIFRFNKFKIVSKELSIFKEFEKNRMHQNNIKACYSIPILINNKLHVVHIDNYQGTMEFDYVSKKALCSPMYEIPYIETNLFSFISIKIAKKFRLILKEAFSDLSKIYKYILNHHTLLHRCIGSIINNKKMYKKRIYGLPKDVRKYIVK